MYQRILVGSDGSATAAKAVDRAVALARTTGARLTIFSAGRPERSRAVVDAEARRHASSGVDIDTGVADTDAVSGLIECARRGGYDLVVTGNRGMTGARRLLPIGSVPNKLSHHLPCSLLIVRTT